MTEALRDAKQVPLSVYFHGREIRAVHMSADAIALEFGQKEFDIPINGRLCEQFANLRTHVEIHAFIRSKGVLWGQTGQSVTISREDWNFEQAKIRWYWQSWPYLEGSTPFAREIRTDWATEEGEKFVMQKAGLSYHAHDLVRVMSLFLASQPSRFLKTCPNPHCKTPFIFAVDGRVKLCNSRECRRWQHKEASREYRANGAKRR